SKVAWSLPWDAGGLDKVELLLGRGAKLDHVLNMATLLDTRSNHILFKRYADKNLMDAQFREKAPEEYAAFLSRFDVARTLTAQEKALVLLNTKWRPELLDGKPRQIVACGVDWELVLKQSLVKLFFGFNRMQTDDVSWRRGHPVFGQFVSRFAGDIREQLSPETLTQVAIHLARWKPVPELHLTPILELGACAREVLASLPAKDDYYRRMTSVFEAFLDDNDIEELWLQFTIRQFFNATKDRMDRFRRARFANRILPQMGNAVITHLTADKIAPLHFRLKSTPRIANLVLDDIRWMVNEAREMGASSLDADPCDGIVRFEPELQTLHPDDLPRAYAPEPDQYSGTSEK
ncbi:hypothetical protein AB9K41_19025, partial [Cribrihabitans sp. XS_ASV171]